MRPISDQVVVVTGASSGIGRATAQLLGSQGARVGLVARNENALRAAAREVEQAGGEAEVVRADVSDWGQVDSARERVVERFGRVDAWVNNAGISIYADLAALTADEMKRIVEVNLLGQMYGCKAAFEQIRSQGGEGVILNVSSALARRSVPLQSVYCGAKHGITGFTEAIRMDLHQSYPGIRVVEILPSSINTPLFTHARSKLPQKPMPIPPIYEASVVAEAIVAAIERPQREVFAGGAGKVFAVAERLSPGLVDAYLRQGDRGVRQQLSGKPDDGRDNLFEPFDDEGAIAGDWSEEAHQVSSYTRSIELHPARKVALATAAAGASLLAAWRLARR